MNKILEFMLNTPEKYWAVILGVHLKKAFWGFLCLLAGILLLYFGKDNKSMVYWGIVFFVFGCICILLGVLGNIYTENTPYLKLWQPYP